MIERHVHEVLVSWLSGCGKERPCRAVDLGANNGWFTAFMLALGAHVISVEPQSDLARAVAETAALHCWSSRSVVFNAFACGAPCEPIAWNLGSRSYAVRPSKAGVSKTKPGSHIRCPFSNSLQCVKVRRAPKDGNGIVPCVGRACAGYAENTWRYKPTSLSANPAKPSPAQIKRGESIRARLKSVGGISIEQIFLGSHLVAFDATPPAVDAGSSSAWQPSRLQRPIHFDLVKLDGDGPEVTWLRQIADLIALGELSIDTITFESNTGINPGLMQRFDILNYTCLRLDSGDERRYMTSKGWDGFSPPGTFARLNRVRKLPRDQYEEELFGVRAMRHVFRISKGLNITEWATVLAPVRRAAPHFVLTREDALLEPSFGESSRRGWRLRSVEWERGGRGTSFAPRADGMD